MEAAAQGRLTVRRAEPWEVSQVVQFVHEHFSLAWANEVQMAVLRQPPCVYVAEDAGELVGFAAFHATRLDFFGPEGVLEAYRGRGLGRALLLSCLWALYQEGYGYAVIGGAGPQDFYRNCCGAEVIAHSEPGVYGPLRRQRRE